MADDPAPIPPAGDYAIVELLGHRTIVGRVDEIERFGTKLLAIETLYDGALLPPILVGGAAIYQITYCAPEVALQLQATRRLELPRALRLSLPPEALPAPATLWVDDGEDVE